MTTLRHAIKVAASRDEVYRAFTDIGGVAGWHQGSVHGEVSVGKTLTVERRPGQRFRWRTDALDPAVKIVQTCVEGPGASVGKTLHPRPYRDL